MHNKRLVPAFALSLAVLLVSSVAARAQSSAEASQIDPDRGRELTNRALDFLHKGEDATSPEEKLAAYSEGEKLARQAVELDPMSADAHFALFANNGRRLLNEGVGANPIRLLQVNRELDRCLELNPNHTDALAARGGMYRQLPRLLGGSLIKAEEYLSRAVSLDPQAVGARIELARTYCDMGEPERATPLLKTAAYWADRLGKKRELDEARALIADLAKK